MARAALKWSIDELAERACLGRMTVLRFERGDNVDAASVEAMRLQLEAQGMKFTGARKGAYGVTDLRMD